MTRLPDLDGLTPEQVREVGLSMIRSMAGKSPDDEGERAFDAANPPARHLSTEGAPMIATGNQAALRRVAEAVSPQLEHVLGWARSKGTRWVAYATPAPSGGEPIAIAVEEAEAISRIARIVAPAVRTAAARALALHTPGAELPLIVQVGVDVGVATVRRVHL